MLEYSILRDESIIEYNPLVSHLTEIIGQGNPDRRGMPYKKGGAKRRWRCPQNDEAEKVAERRALK